MMKKVLFLILLACVVLVACAPSPQDEAEAFAIRLKAEQDAADRQAVRSMPHTNTSSDMDAMLPWLVPVLCVGVPFFCINGCLFLYLYNKTHEVENQQYVPVVQKILIDRVGRGKYRLSQSNGVQRLLDWNNVEDRALLEQLNSNR